MVWGPPLKRQLASVFHICLMSFPNIALMWYRVGRTNLILISSFIYNAKLIELIQICKNENKK